MTDSTDDMEVNYARTFCRECEKHIDDCECGKPNLYVMQLI